MRFSACALFLILCPALVPAQQATKPQDRLLTARVIYVAPMPGKLDQWIINDLQAWGKYRIVGDSEGVDLVLRAVTPPKHIEYTRSEHIPIRSHANKEPAILSLTVVNWVTGEKVWEARILNRNRKKNHNPPPGPDTEIDARKMKPDQVAERCVNLLRDYVTQLEASGKK
jgi:hypothetical protein